MLCGAVSAAAHAAAPQRLDAALLAFARQTLQAQAEAAGWRAPEFELNPQSLGARAQAACQAGWQLQAQDTRSLLRLRFRATCPDQGSEAAHGWDVLLRARLSAEVLVATQDLAPGRAIAAGDVRWQRLDLTNLPDAFSREEALQAQSLRTRVRAGQALQQRHLEPSLVVRRGEAVRIVARNGGIEVQAAGEALDSGALNATVRVRNLSSGRIIAARVQGPGLVAPVDLPSP